MLQTNVDEIASFFTDDHRNIDRLLEALHQAVDPDHAVAAMDAFEGMLLRHIAWEENTLFPAFTDKLGEEAQVVAEGMRIQHDEMKEHMANLRRSLAGDGAQRRNLEEVLTEALNDHNQAEEGYIYPWIDDALTRDERRTLLGELK